MVDVVNYLYNINTPRAFRQIGFSAHFFILPFRQYPKYVIVPLNSYISYRKTFQSIHCRIWVFKLRQRLVYMPHSIYIYTSISTSLSYQPRVFVCTLTNFFLLIIILLFLFIIAKALSFKALSTDEDTQHKANKRNTRKNTKRKRLALRFDFGSDSEKTPRDEGASCATGSGKRLSKAVKGAENVVVRC